MSRCAKCQQGPAGIVGHFDLFVFRVEPDAMQFKCAACGQLWTRRQTAQGRFEWHASEGELRGLSIPGWRPRRFV